MTQDALQILIAEAALLFAALSFLTHLAYSLGWVQTPPQKVEEEVKSAMAAASDARATASPQQAIDLVNALATLTESLAKSGPALWSLIGAVLFLLVASLAAGVFQAAA